MEVLRFTLLVVLGVLSLSRGQEIQNGVCVENQCRELPPGEDCSDQTSWEPQDMPGCPPDPLRDCVCHPCDNSLDIPLTVEVELHHMTEDQFVMTITWNQTQSADMISGYTVILSSGEYRSYSCQEVADLSTIYCTEQCTSLPPTATTFNFALFYILNTRTIQIEVIPQPSCAGTTIQMDVPIRTCHYVRPGDCTVCGQQDIWDIQNLKADPSWSEYGRTMDVDISWQILDRGYYMQRPYSSMTFYLTVKQHPEGFIATPVLEVVGKSDVTLHNLNPCMNYSVEVKFCGCNRTTEVLIFSLDHAVSATTHPYTSLSNPTALMIQSTITSTPTTSQLLTTACPTAPSQTPTTVLMTTSASPVVNSSQTQTSKISHLHTTLRPTTSMHTTTATELSSTLPEHQPMSSTPLQSTQTPSVHPPISQPNDHANDHYLYPMALGIPALGILVLTVIIILVKYCWPKPPPKPPGSPGTESSNTDIDDPECMHSLVTSPQPSPSKYVTLPVTSSKPSIVMAPPKPPKKSVLLVYSEASPQPEKEVILECLVKPLHDPHGVKVEIYDTQVTREAPVSWLPIMVEKCDIVLCVCNQQFQQEWMGNSHSPSVVYCLRQLINAAVTSKEYMSKYAVVLMNNKHRDLIPSYLNNCREFIFDPKTIPTNINNYVKHIPKYQFPQAK